MMEKPKGRLTFVDPVSVISSIFTLDKEQQRFLDAATNNDLQAIKAFIEKLKPQCDEWRMYFLADAALILATQHSHYDAVKLLLSQGFIIREPHSRSCQCKECSSLGVLLKSLSRLNTYKAMSNPMYLSYCYLYAVPLSRSLEQSPHSFSPGSEFPCENETLKTKLDPIYRAFELNGKLERLASSEYEFKREYRRLSNQCEEYAVDLLNLCHNMDEIACVMSMPRVEGNKAAYEDTADLSVLNFAIKNKNERFVAHPYSQLMLNSVLYHGLPGWQYRSLFTKTIVILIFSILLPFWSIWYIIAPQNSMNVILKTPLAKFLSDVVSFLWFVVLLVMCSVEDALGETIAESTISKRLTIVWVVGLIGQEIKECFRQGSQRYFSQWWNMVTIVMLFLFVLSAILWFIGYTVLSHDSELHNRNRNFKYFHHLFEEIPHEWAFKFVLLSNTFYSMAFILSFLHVSNALQVNSTIGPLHLSLVQMCGDVLKFLLLFSIFYFAFGFAIRKVYSQYVLIASSPFVNSTSPVIHKFADISRGFSDLFWALFDKTELESFRIGRSEFRITEITGEMLFAIYNIAAILVALNMLIAMMANSFQKVADDADIQWKFHRTRMWMQYVDKGSPVPPPLNLIPNWKSIVSSIRWVYKMIQKRKYEEVEGKVKEDITADESDRKIVIISLVNRYFARKAEYLNRA